MQPQGRNSQNLSRSCFTAAIPQLGNNRPDVFWKASRMGTTKLAGITRSRSPISMMRILGARVFVDRATLGKLVGRQLVVRRVDSGGRTKPGANRQVLIAVKLSPAEAS